MYTIPQITSDALQQNTYILWDGSQVQITLFYCIRQQAWFIRNLTYGSFILNNFRVHISPNMFHQFRNEIPFGLACYSVDGREPDLQQDFSSGNYNLFFITPSEMAEYGAYLTGV